MTDVIMLFLGGAFVFLFVCLSVLRGLELAFRFVKAGFDD